MTEKSQEKTSAIHHVSSRVNDNSVIVRVPKPSLQIIVLGLIAIITLFQTVQLIRINASNGSAKTMTAPAASSNAVGNGSGTGSNANVPESMVGGC